jgi:hypothetical protein
MDTCFGWTTMPRGLPNFFLFSSVFRIRPLKWICKIREMAQALI